MANETTKQLHTTRSFFHMSENSKQRESITMASPFPPRDDESNMCASSYTLFNPMMGSGLSAVSDMTALNSPSKRIDHARFLSKATSQATLAAKTILSAEGSEDAALKVAKAAAQATLIQCHMGTAGFSNTMSGPSAYRRRRKIKSQSEIVASMALTTAIAELCGKHAQYGPMNSRDDTAVQSPVQRVSINVTPVDTTREAAKQSMSTPTALTHLPPMFKKASRSTKQFKRADIESGASEDSEVSRLSMESASDQESEAASNLPRKVSTKSLGRGSISKDDSIEVENKASSTSNSTSKPNGKPLEKGSLSLSRDGSSEHVLSNKQESQSIYSGDNIEVVKEDSGSETKENSAPKETPTLLVAPSRKKADRKSSLKQVPSISGPPSMTLPKHSTQEEVLQKDTPQKNVLTPSGAHLPQDEKPRDSRQTRQDSSQPKAKDSATYISVTQSLRSEMNDTVDDETLANEPIYTVQNGRMQNEQYDYTLTVSSSEDSSLFSSTTADTADDPFFSSLFSDILKCVGDDLTEDDVVTVPDKRKSVKKSMKKTLVTLIDKEERDERLLDMWTPCSRREDREEVRNPTSEGRGEIEDMRQGAHMSRGNDDSAMSGTMKNSYLSSEEKPSRNPKWWRRPHRNESSDMHQNSTRSSEETPSGDPNQWRQPRTANGKWRKALGMKPASKFKQRTVSGRRMHERRRMPDSSSFEEDREL